MQKAKLFDLIPVQVFDNGLWDVDAEGVKYHLLNAAAAILLRIYAVAGLKVLVTDRD